MHRNIRLMAIAGIALLSLATAATAGDLSGTVGVTSAYISRGTDQNLPGGPALQASLTYTNGGFYASTFASTMDFADGSKQELDFFTGYRFPVGKFKVDVGLANINYPNNSTPLNFIEYDVKVDLPVGKGNVGVWYGYTDAYFNTYGEGHWTEAHGSYTFTDNWSVSGAVAKQALPNNFSYQTFNVGATYVTGSVSVDVRYSDTDRHDLDPWFDSYGARTSVTLTKSFY